MLGGRVRVKIQIETPGGQVRQAREALVDFSRSELLGERLDIESTVVCVVSDQMHTALREYLHEQENKLSKEK